MKKLTPIALLLAVIFLLASCDSKSGASSETTASDSISSVDVAVPESNNPADYIDMTYIEYPNVSRGYSDILNHYRMFLDCFFTVKEEYGAVAADVKFNSGGDNDNEYMDLSSLPNSYSEYGSEFSYLMWHNDKSVFGYGIYDLNGDGID
ncbi:MAG: hypothetical protein LBL82_00545 [Oscillospiraceae bacterium]|jgi:hypothetical protein|nr:hypothetical protein [Oscillospiraceae bacterium]